MFPGVSFLCKDKFRAFEDHPRRLWGPPTIRRVFRGAICSPPLAKPCGFVPGSKIFTEIPRRRLPPAALSAARFAPRKALRHRSGEQNLHRDSAPPSASGGLSRGAICSPPPGKPCGTVSGSKIFTAIPRRRLPPAAFPAVRFAPRPPQSLWAPSRGAKSSQQFRAAPGGRLQSAGFSAARFAPRSPQSLVVPSRGAKSSQQFRAAACLRRPF